MKLQKHKEEPFYVKKIRLKHSVIKTNEILQTIAISDLDSKKYHTMREEHRGTPSYAELFRSYTRQKSVNESQLYHNKANMVNYDKMRKLLKVCNHKKSEQNMSEMFAMGLEVRRIVGDPQSRQPKKKRLHHDHRSLQNQRESAEHANMSKLTVSSSFKNARVRNLKTFEGWQQDTTNQQEDLLATYNSDYADRQQKQKEMAVSYDKLSSPRSPKRRNKVYLYEKMAGIDTSSKEQANQIYEKRIKSYTQFLWKNMIAHNIYINLDLPNAQTAIKKRKAFIGFGNNCNMIRGLIKRRFWWTVAEQLTDQCCFVWTQLKINKILQKQQPAPVNQVKYIEEVSFEESKKRLSKTCVPSKRRYALQSNLKKTERQKNNDQGNRNCKLLNEQDMKRLKPFFEKYQPQTSATWDRLKSKDISYVRRTRDLQENYKAIKNLQSLDIFDSTDKQLMHSYYKSRPIVHNHFENNFLLGNKKALFYNLRDHYRQSGRNVFEYVPLTFHIKKGVKDPEYKRFVQYYQGRQRKMKREEQQEVKGSRKMRNIWIVKPGQNTNQGRGITVIDEIYQLNNIIKQSQKTDHIRQSPRTFIVQMYIDRPLLYNDRKFDIRHYILVTNLYGVMRAYWYQQGYIRTSSYAFNIGNFQPQIHLTNDSIQKQYPQYSRYQPGNKVSYSQFQSYLNSLDKKCDFRKDIIPKMKEMALDAVRSIAKRIAPQQQMNNFQIFGLDFMIDRQLKPWLIEINTNPCLDCFCPLLDRIIPYMLQQSLKLSLDLVYPPPCHYPNTAKHLAPFVNLETFKYELMFDSAVDLSTEGMNRRLLAEIGEIEEDEEFNDNGKEIKLEDYT